jgi:hypothetical protein
MVWRTQKTRTGQDLIYDGVEMGIAPSPTTGTANIQNANIATETGEVMASFARVNQAQADIVDGTLTASVGDGTTLLDAPAALYSGAWIKVTASTISGITATTNPTTAQISYLNVGGGGGGGGSDALANDTGGGGGGAGEVSTGTANVGVGPIAITVGDGGASGTAVAAGSSGASSVIQGIDTAVGGGGGGSAGAGATLNGLNGASGGGGGGNQDAGTAGTAGTGTAGNNGGAGSSSGNGGGGGGANSAGSAAGAAGGDGGNGVASTITGTSVTYGGGGGGGSSDPGGPGDGGTGGGGNGASNGNGTAGTANTGGGGGGASTDAGSGLFDGGRGGSGIVIISYTTGSMFATGGDEIIYTATNTVHIFRTSGTFTVTQIVPDGMYYVSYKNGSNKIKLSSNYDPYGSNPLTHGTSGTATFTIVATVNSPIAKAVETYGTATNTEYRYYILDANSRVWVYDTQVYETTLVSNGVGVTWMLPDPVSYSGTPIRGIAILNGWLMGLTVSAILCKPTVNLGGVFLNMYNGFLMNPFPTHPNYAMVGSQGKMYYTDGVFLGEVFPTTSLVTSLANLQSYAKYTAVTTLGTITTLIGGSVPFPTDGSRLPAVFFTDKAGTLPTAITPGKVYYIDYEPITQKFRVYTQLSGGSLIDIETGASGNQYFNTFYPPSNDAGANGTTPLVQFTPQRVNLPFYEVAQRLVEVGNTIIIGCQGATLYPWNQIDPTPSDIIPLPEANVQSMINVNNAVYVFAGNKGNIYITNNSVASLALKVPDYCAGVPGTPLTYIEPYFTWGDSMFVRGRVYFSILDQTSTKAGNCGGVWSFIPPQNIDPSQEVGMALRLENQNSYGTYSGYATVLLPMVEQLAVAPQYWAGWQSSYSTGTSTFGLDFTAGTPVTQYVIETDLLPTGSLLEKQTFAQLEYKLTTPLASGDGVQLYYRLNSTDAWATCGTVKVEAANPISGYFDQNFQKTQWVQFRAVVTTNGTTSSSFGRLKQIHLR